MTYPLAENSARIDTNEFVDGLPPAVQADYRRAACAKGEREQLKANKGESTGGEENGAADDVTT